jgi:hypothetical protein
LNGIVDVLKAVEKLMVNAEVEALVMLALVILDVPIHSVVPVRFVVEALVTDNLVPVALVKLNSEIFAKLLQKLVAVRLVEEALVRIALVLVNAGAVTKPDALILNTEDVEV